MSEELLAVIDVERRTTRGRSCPRCGGKIIPSIRAVYQATNPADTFPSWQCERCGYEEVVSGKGMTVSAKVAAGGEVAMSSQLPSPQPKPKPDMFDTKGRVLPPDVTALMKRFGQSEAKDT